MKYRTKPIVIEARQLPRSMNDLCTEQSEILAWMMENDSSILPGKTLSVTENGWLITTLEGVMLASWEDWIIRGVQGEFYPCKPDIFEATYEPAL